MLNERQLKIVDLLEQQPRTPGELAQQTGVSGRTILRDIDYRAQHVRGRYGPIKATEHTVPNGKQSKPVTDIKPHFTWRDGVMRKGNRTPITFSPANRQRRSRASARTGIPSWQVNSFLSP